MMDGCITCINMPTPSGIFVPKQYYIDRKDPSMTADECSVMTTFTAMSTVCRDVHAPFVTPKNPFLLLLPSNDYCIHYQVITLYYLLIITTYYNIYGINNFIHHFILLLLLLLLLLCSASRLLCQKSFIVSK